jgi:hypothetical protein
MRVETFIRDVHRAQASGVFSHVHCSEDNAGRETFIRDVQSEQARGRFFSHVHCSEDNAGRDIGCSSSRVKSVEHLDKILIFS